jgi:hypothetical protein
VEQEQVLEYNHEEAQEVERYVKPRKPSAEVYFVVHLVGTKLRSPHLNKHPGFKSKARYKIPEGGKT